jgi:hypothetical protein
MPERAAAGGQLRGPQRGREELDFRVPGALKQQSSPASRSCGEKASRIDAEAPLLAGWVESPRWARKRRTKRTRRNKKMIRQPRRNRVQRPPLTSTLRLLRRSRDGSDAEDAPTAPGSCKHAQKHVKPKVINKKLKELAKTVAEKRKGEAAESPKKKSKEKRILFRGWLLVLCDMRHHRLSGAACAFRQENTASA